MRFWTGVLLGLLLAGPTVHNHYHVTETNRLRMDLERNIEPPAVYEIVEPWQDVEGSERCVIDLLGGPGAGWDADDVLAVLDEAWEAGVSPCELER